MKLCLLGLTLWLAAAGAWANEAAPSASAMPDNAEARQRGAETVVTVCLGCHSLKYIKYHDLAGLGFDKAKLEALRAGHKPGDALVSKMTADAGRQAFGIAPPDLSLMARARAGGAQHVSSYLTSFYRNEKGANDNRILPGARMPDILGVSFATGELRASINSKAREVALFLEWTAEPSVQERQSLGRYVLAYLIALTILLYLLKRRAQG